MTVAALSEYRVYTRRLTPSLACLGFYLLPALLLSTAVAETPPVAEPANQSSGNIGALAEAVAPLSADSADADTALTQFIAMVETRDWANARVMANALLDRFEGTPRFDLYYAQVLIQEGRAQEAIFTLERILVYAPERHRVRLDLARAYFINNNLERSRTEFKQVLATNPPANVRDNINEFLSRIEAAQRAQIQQFQMFAGLDVGYDTNINGGATLNEPLAPNLLGLTDLSDASKAIDSGFGRFRLGSTWVRPTHLRAANLYSLQGLTTLSPGNSGYNQLGLNGQWRYQSNTDRSRQTLAVNAGQLWLDNQPWQFSLNLSAEASFPAWDAIWLGPIASSSLSFAQQDGRSNSVRDALGLVATVQDAPRRHRFVSQYIQFNRAGTDNGFNEWRGLAQQYQLDWRWPNRLTTSLALEHQWHRYQADDRLFVEQGTTDNKRRSDQRLAFDASLTWVPEPWLTSRSGLRYSWLDSNINAYSRDQWVISQSLTLTF
ncbi:tetratricopeptide repeat protein [Saccharospirillum impatiens]|uniref:tetratricopeptide repeat protein n=1 Tax=Saccharospirillum impatiens TaxID=169438 RepID=UPI0004204E85|nr:tetratricopeptide repeat protein [Saccharospirillum impatiens]